MSSSVPK